jgi:hypothetical protein
LPALARDTGKNNMAYIRVIHPSAAAGRLAKLYERITGPGGQVDNVLQIHSLRPHTLEGHLALYKAVLHHPRNSLPRWFLEAIAVRVSLLNDCEYCARHHSAGMQKMLQREPGHYDAYRAQLDQTDPGRPFSRREQAALLYVTPDPATRKRWGGGRGGPARGRLERRPDPRSTRWPLAPRQPHGHRPRRGYRG